MRGDQAIGFALVHVADDGAALCVEEFYIGPGDRRRGAGTAAATALFKAQPGSWILSMLARDSAARAFWPKAIALAGGVDVRCAVQPLIVTYRFNVSG
jgi:predicted acetyltransferase